MLDNFKTISWRDGKLFMIDQNKLPHELTFKVCKSVEDVVEAISNMTVRGAPAIGVAAAMGLALAAYHYEGADAEGFIERMFKAAEIIKSTRPTAQNLFWAVKRVLKVVEKGGSVEDLRRKVLMEAERVVEEDVEVNMKIGRVGVEVLKDGDTILTHCNAGALATVAYGTALAPVREAVGRGLKVSVIATETRPKLQGARLTAFELKLEGIPVTVITDNMVGYVMEKGMVDKIIVGADRVFKEGHVINKIGTLTLAIVAKYFNIPFYVAAPTSTFDLTSKVNEVVIEERSRDEVAYLAGISILPSSIKVLNPAFDITPPELISQYITERGLLKPPFEL